MAQLIQNKNLTPRAKENLERNEQIRRDLENQNSKFIKMQSNEQLVLYFDAEKVEAVEKDFGHGPKPQFQYTVINPTTGSEQIFTASKTASKDIDGILYAQGPKRLIRVRRIGEGKSTVYVFDPEGEP